MFCLCIEKGISFICEKANEQNSNDFWWKIIKNWTLWGSIKGCLWTLKGFSLAKQLFFSLSFLSRYKQSQQTFQVQLKTSNPKNFQFVERSFLMIRRELYYFMPCLRSRCFCLYSNDHFATKREFFSLLFYTRINKLEKLRRKFSELKKMCRQNFAKLIF